MPADLEEALKKKGGLTLTQLANYDDILTDALVDRVYFWAHIRKVKAAARPCRGIREEDVCRVLQSKVIIEKDPTGATKEMLRQSGFQNYMRSLRTEDEKEHFQRHLRRYINIYLGDCPFEVCTTHRYTITTAEACVVARKPIKAGEAIKYLSGIQVEMSEDEEAELSSRTDFSIVLSSRRKRPSLFLGPARFANHDCDSNARLTTTGPHGITIVACKNIAVGDEITVRYGDDYFGEDNCECLCGTCESLVRNGWDPRGPVLADSSSDEESEAGDERPRKRQRTSGIFDAADIGSEGPSTSRSAPLKRKHDAAFVKQEVPSTGDAPRKRGRPRKHPIPVEKVTEQHSAYARDFLSEWFRVRAGVRTAGADVDVIQVRRAVNNRNGSNQYSSQDIPEDKQHYHKANSVFQLLQERGQAELEDYQTRLGVLKAKNAEALNISIEEAEKYYAPPGHADFVPLPIPLRTRSDHRRASDKKVQTNSTTKEMNHQELSTQPVQRERTALRTAPGSTRLLSLRRQPTGSPLRKVTLAMDDEDADSSFEDVRNGTKLMPGAAIPNAAGATQPSTTDDSSRSSVFSNDTVGDPISPPSSHGDISAFAAGNICQNIVEMYTTGTIQDAEDDIDMQDAAQAQLQIEQDLAEEEDSSRASKRRRRRAGSTSEAVDSIEQRPDRRRPHQEQDSEDDEEERRGPIRTPGDYTLTSALLIDINDRWIECRNCDEHFVQHDAYQTRIACPRCERHSKLYGYHWPKTDKIGKDDKEERVLDHRLIHRFIDPDEERQERKGRKTLAVLKDRGFSDSQEAESSSGGTRDDSRRRSRRFA